MKSSVLVFSIFVIFITNIQAQLLKYFDYAPSEIAVCVRETSDSCYILAIGGGPSPDKGIIVKINAAGNVLWQNQDASFIGSASHVIENANTDYTFLEEHSIVQAPNIVLKRFSKTGALIWSKYPLVPWQSYGGSLIEDNNSNLIITGTVQNCKVLLIKCNQLGDTIFTKTYSDPFCIKGSSISTAIDQGYILTCAKYSTYNGNIQSTVIIKVDTLGNELWRKDLSQTRFGGIDAFKTVDNNKYAIASSQYDSLTNFYQPKLTLLDLNGDTIFTQLYPTPTSSTALALHYEPCIGFTIVTNGENGPQLLFTDIFGSLYCTIPFSSSLYNFHDVFSLIKNQDGKFVVCGSAYDTYFAISNSFVGVIDSTCINTMPLSADAGEEKTICKGESVLVGTTANPLYAYNWQPSTGLDNHEIAQPLASPEQTITYYLTATHTQGCDLKGRDSILITVENCKPALNPNIFTPNNDGNNDVFKIEANGSTEINVEIYNRWGTKVYEWNALAGFWDGRTTAGAEVPPGIYYYLATLKDVNENVSFEKGFVKLLR